MALQYKRLVRAMAAGGVAQAIAALGWLGGNLEEIKSYTSHLLYSDVVKHGYSFLDYTTGAIITTAGGGLGADGWPVVDFRFGGGTHGNWPPGTYTGTITGRTGVPVPEVGASVTVSNIVNTSGFTVTFTVVTTGPADSANPVIKFSGCGGCTNLQIFRPGLSGASPVHNPDAISYYKQHGVIRFMKSQGAENSKSVPANWTGTIASGGRGTPANNKSGWAGEDGGTGTVTYLGMAAEDIVDFCDALYAASGSKFQHAWICVNALWGDSYITSFLTLIRDRKTQPWKIICERGNEQWNSSYTTNYGTDLVGARDAIDALANNGAFYTQISSASSDATTLTITAASNLPGTWTTGRHIDFNLNSLVYRDETITVTGATTFTVTPTSRACPGAGAVSVTGCFFVGDRTNPINFDSLPNPAGITGGTQVAFAIRYHAKRTREIALIAESIFGSLNGTFKMVLCFQRPTTTFSSGQATMLEYLNTQFVDRAPKTYLYALAHAPYAQPVNQADNEATLLAAVQASVTTELANSLLGAEMAYSYGLPILCYEGGPSTLLQTTPTVATVTALYADAAMRTLTYDLWKGHWDRGFQHVAHMDIHFQAATLIRVAAANDKYFEIDESLDAALHSPSQRSLAFQDLWAYRPPTPSVSSYPIPGVIDGVTYTRVDCSSSLGHPAFIWSKNSTAGVRLTGGDFNGLNAAEKAKSHYIMRGGMFPTVSKAMTLELAIYMTSVGNQSLTVTIEDETAGTSTDYAFTATPNTTTGPVPYQTAVAVGSYVVGHVYNFTVTVPAGCTRNLAIGNCRFT